MGNLGFKLVDFEVFTVEGFNDRMQQIYAHVRPKLVKLGEELAPELNRQLNREFFPHVAKHARRTVNPPPETWAAFGPSPRGYKRYRYLALCVSAAGLHARVAVKSEADDRAAMAQNLRERAGQLTRNFKGTTVARYDKWDFVKLPTEQRVETSLIEALAENLAKKTGGLDVGFGWNLRESLRLDRAELLDAFRELEPLFGILRPS